MLPGRDYIDQWNMVCKKLGTPGKDFFNRLQPNVRNYCENQPKFRGFTVDELVPDSCFPNATPDDRRKTHQGKDLMCKMLQIDPLKRISVSKALEHPYVNIWYDESEVHVTPPPKYDHGMDERNLKLDEWKELIYQEVVSYN